MLTAQPKVQRLLSSEHFSVDGTLIQAWASMKSFKPLEGPDDPSPPLSGGRNVETDFRGETRSNATLASTTDPDAKLYRKGAGMEAKLAFLGHALMESRRHMNSNDGEIPCRRAIVETSLGPANSRRQS